MKLARIAVKNFKSIPSSGVELSFREGLIVLVGKNNAGKSNILEALGMLFGSRSPRYLQIPEESFNDPARPLVMEAELAEVSWGDGKALGMSDQQCGSLTHEGKKVQTAPGHITLRFEVPAPNEDASETHLVDDSEDAAEEAPAKQTFQVFLANRHEVKRNEDLRRALVRHVQVPALRAYGDVLSPSGWTAYGRLLRDILVDSDKTEQLVGMINHATGTLREILSGEAEALTQAAKSTAYVDKVDFQLTKDGNPVELLRNLSLSVTYGDRTEDISTVGTGTQSAVIVGVLELCLRHRPKRGIRLFSVEEPELFLHPHAQRHLAALLREIASEPGSQVIFTTHSPCILPDLDLLDVVKVDRDSSGGTRCLSVPADWEGLDEAERILTTETCEMLFADRVVLVEGPSEGALLPALARLVPVSDESEVTCDFDRLNVSVVNVGGKDHFAPYTDLLDQLAIEWRIITDADALTGAALSAYRERAAVLASMSEKDRRNALAQVGVFVMPKGEIEDYYPSGALAAIAECAEDEVAGKVAEHKASYEDATAYKMVQATIIDHQDEICAAEASRLPKLMQGWYSKTVDKLRQTGEITPSERKTGDALERWLKRPKPAIAAEVARWFAEDPSRLEERWRSLIRWLVRGLVPEPEEQS